MSVAWLTANVQGTIRTRSKHRVHLIQQSIRSRVIVSAVIPLKRAFRGGSKSSREVVVHVATGVVHIIVEVVFMSRGCSGSTGSSRVDGSGSRTSWK